MNAFLEMLHAWRRELLTAGRDGGVLIFILFVPLAYPLLYSYVYTNEVVRNVPVAVVDESNTPLSRRLTRMLDATPDVGVARRCASMAEAQEMLMRRQVYAVVRMPASLDLDIWRGDQTYVGVYCDMSSMLYYKAVMLAANNAALELNRDIKVRHHLPQSTDRDEEVVRTPVEFDYVALFNPQSGFAAFLIPPVLMLIIQQTLLLGVGMAAGAERERNGGRLTPPGAALRTLPTVLGKALFYFLLYMLMGVYMYAAVTRWFGLPQLGRLPTFLALLAPYLLACIFLAMALSAFIYRREDCIMLFVFLSVPMLFLSGISWPWHKMPQAWHCLAWLFPSTPGMNGYVRIQAVGASIADVATELRALWLQAAAYLAAALMLYRSQSAKTDKRKPPKLIVKNGQI